MKNYSNSTDLLSTPTTTAQVVALNTHLPVELQAALKLTYQHRISTPAIVLSKHEVNVALNRFQSFLPSVALYYAMKANSAEQLLSYLASSDLNFDVASAAEVLLLDSLGVSGDRMVLSHPVKDPKTIQTMLAKRVKAFAVDSIAELDKIALYSRDYVPNVFVRIRTESEDVQIDLNDKYGCRLTDAIGIVKHAQDVGFNPVGLTFHVGTQSYLASNYQVGFDHCLVVAEQVRRRYDIKLTTFNMGGGFCDPYVAKNHGVTLDQIFSEIGRYVDEVVAQGYSVIAEPGRTLVSNAGSLVTQVIGINKRGGAVLVHIDDGVYGALSGQVFDHREYVFEPLPRRAGSSAFSQEEVVARICGRTCDSIDMINGNHRLPSDIAVGDLLFVRNIGAYGSATASRFNGFEPARTFLFDTRHGAPTFPSLATGTISDSERRRAVGEL